MWDKGPLDLLTLPSKQKVHGKAVDLVSGLQKVHTKVRANLEAANARYKQAADQKRRLVELQVGDFVWAILTKDRFPVGEYNKLSARKIDPVEVVAKMNPNAYKLKLPSHIRTSDVFKVKHLVPYAGDSSDDEVGVNSRTNFFSRGENDAVEELAFEFLDAFDRNGRNF